MVSHLALIGLRPPFGSSHQCGMRPQRSGSSDTSAGLVVAVTTRGQGGGQAGISRPFDGTGVAA